MGEILIRAGCFVFIIIMGYILRKAGYFKEEDFGVLAKLVLKITLPAAIISSFSGKEIDLSLLFIVLLGLGGGLIYMISGYMLNRKHGKAQQAFGLLNTSGYNIGNFTLPFVQSFLGPMGVVVTSLFDTGNACVCLGGAYSVASMVKDNCGFSFKKIGKTLIKSVPFDCYMFMISMNLLHIPTPTPIVTLAEIIGNANAFVAMFMIGVGFKLSGNKKQIKDIAKILTIRYSLAAIFAVVFYFFLPFAIEVRQTLVILTLSPIASAVPAFTKDLNGDVGLSSAINSISIIISIILIVSMLLVMA